VLVDTSVWVDHFRRGNDLLADRLRGGEVWTHPFVIGELACGALERRSEILRLLATLPHAPLLEHRDVLEFVESHRLMAQGIGWIDVHLLASATLGGISVWTLDRRLHSVARRLRLTADSQ
jgi:predicted nucleic acid-binding protein